MNRTTRLLSLFVLGGIAANSAFGQQVAPQGSAPPPGSQRRSSAIPGRVFPNELAAQANAIHQTAHGGVPSVVRVQPFLLDVPDSADPYAGRRPADPAAPSRPFQNASPPRMAAGFNRGGGVTREEQLRAQSMGLQREQFYRSQSNSQYPISLGFPIGNGAGLGNGGFAFIGIR